ncbi:hypothetical protein L211DRAFT_848855 [Terfezia boudieri ATCC MYA-4762]|uniref:Uncharacterized protein n=1 Tax=Terfezia boudieri ATCC MYA-4762 TaxID=1051890 RepID=A0A3N4LNR4_9PEZI|nr:hypothetical protein L211DRAFT_848855 [Terfezia boudieri ATCC MYA-4762]
MRKDGCDVHAGIAPKLQVFNLSPARVNASGLHLFEVPLGWLMPSAGSCNADVSPSYAGLEYHFPVGVQAYVIPILPRKGIVSHNKYVWIIPSQSRWKLQILSRPAQCKEAISTNLRSSMNTNNKLIIKGPPTIEATVGSVKMPQRPMQMQTTAGCKPRQACSSLIDSLTVEPIA